jgi:F0F1-type ATP synthase assembly protein I
MFEPVPSDRMRRLLAKMLRLSPKERPASFDEVIAELLRVKAEVAEDQADRLDESTRLRGGSQAAAKAPVSAPGLPRPGPESARPATPRATPVQAEAPASQAKPSPSSRLGLTSVSVSVSTKGLAVIAAVLILGAIALNRMHAGLPWMAGAFLIAGLAAAALSVHRRAGPAAMPGSLPAPAVVRGAPAAPASAVAEAAPALEPAESAIETFESNARLVVTGDGPTRDHRLGGDQDGSWPAEILIGRGVPQGPAAVRIASRAVSAVQARLRHQGGTFSVENLSKTNTTRVNGRELSPGEKRLLTVGDRIEMGPVVVSLQIR